MRIINGILLWDEFCNIPHGTDEDGNVASTLTPLGILATANGVKTNYWLLKGRHSTENIQRWIGSQEQDRNQILASRKKVGAFLRALAKAVEAGT